jgi:hypothetical protein
MSEENRVYFNTDLFSEESKETLTNISVLKYEIKKLAYNAFNIKATYKSLIEEKKIKAKELQAEYEKLSDKEAWATSKNKINLRTKMTLIKTLLKKAQIELKTINSEIKEKNRAIDIFKNQLPK